MKKNNYIKLLLILIFSLNLYAFIELPKLELQTKKITKNINGYDYELQLTLPRGYSVKDLQKDVCIFDRTGKKLKTTSKIENDLLYVKWNLKNFEKSLTLKYRLCRADTRVCIMTQKIKVEFKEDDIASSKTKALPLLFIFFSGILTALSPCVLPIIPLVFGFIGLSKNKKQGIINSIILILSMAISYSILGAFTAKGGGVFGSALQKPVFNIIAGSIVILMGSSLLGLFEMQAPSTIMQKISSFRGRGVFTAFVMGLFIGVIGMPCVGPVLISILTYISTTQDVLFGGGSLFLYALGIGVVFFVSSLLSLYSGKKIKQGYWNEFLKTLFSLAIIGTGVYFINKALSTDLSWVVYLLFSSLLMFKKAFSGIPKLFSRIYIILAISFLMLPAYKLYFAIEESHHHQDKIFTDSSKNLNFWINGIENGLKEAKLQNKIVVVDFFADWCNGCKELKHSFSKVYNKFKNDFVFVKVDLTSTTDETIKIAKKYKIRGLPTVLIMCPESGEKIYRFFGAKTEEELEKILMNALEKRINCKGVDG